MCLPKNQRLNKTADSATDRRPNCTASKPAKQPTPLGAAYRHCKNADQAHQESDYCSSGDVIYDRIGLPGEQGTLSFRGK
jgi:hypothetical protein